MKYRFFKHISLRAKKCHNCAYNELKYAPRSTYFVLIDFRPHKLNPIELYELEQRITELELELPRRATDYEYAAWQVKDQLRQARGIEAKLGFNTPSTEDTRRLQHRVAQIRVFLEQASRFTFLQKSLIYLHLHCGLMPIITEPPGNFNI